LFVYGHNKIIINTLNNQPPSGGIFLSLFLGTSVISAGELARQLNELVSEAVELARLLEMSGWTLVPQPAGELRQVKTKRS
jgi:hypothetical protein